jgi:hypothetical protein
LQGAYAANVRNAWIGAALVKDDGEVGDEGHAPAELGTDRCVVDELLADGTVGVVLECGVIVSRNGAKKERAEREAEPHLREQPRFGGRVRAPHGKPVVRRAGHREAVEVERLLLRARRDGRQNGDDECKKSDRSP